MGVMGRFKPLAGKSHKGQTQEAPGFVRVENGKPSVSADGG